MIQLTRSGLRISSPDEVDALREQFARDHAVRLPRLVDPSILENISRAIDRARFRPRRHDHLDPPAQDLALDDAALHGRLLVLFNDASLFRFVEAVSGAGPIRLFHGTVYRMEPDIHHLDSWHDDLQDTRLVALSLNLSRAGYAGGVLEIRTVDPPAIVHQVANTGFGDAVLFRIDPRLEHRLTPIEPGPAKLAWAGWFRREPAFLDLVHGRRA
ncbi:MAG: 2OG-Fe(II) oxygenase [Vicinamibacterales bacterium]